MKSQLLLGVFVLAQRCLVGIAVKKERSSRVALTVRRQLRERDANTRGLHDILDEEHDYSDDDDYYYERKGSKSGKKSKSKKSKSHKSGKSSKKGKSSKRGPDSG